MKFPMEKLRKATKEFPQAKNLLKWEEEQKRSNVELGFWHGMAAGAFWVGAVYFLIVWIYG